MKTKHTIFILTAFLGLFCIYLEAVAGERTKGGAHVEYVNGKPRLLDDNKAFICDLFEGAEFIETLPRYSPMLESIRKLDWYLALTMDRSVRDTLWCFTGELEPVSVTDRKGTLKVPKKKFGQLAVRPLGGSESSWVYFNGDLFDSLPSDDERVYSVFHEVSHEFLPLNLNQRKLKLRSLKRVFQKVVENKIQTRGDFRKKLNNLGFQFYADTKRLEVMREGLEFILSPTEERVRILESHKDLGILLNQVVTTKKFAANLNHIGSFYNLDAFTIKAYDFLADLKSLIASLNVDQVRKIFDKPHDLPHAVVLALLSGVEDFPELKHQILSSQFFSSRVNGFLSTLASAQASFQMPRVVVPEVIRFFGVSTKVGPYVPVTSILPFSSMAELQDNPLTSIFVEYLVYLIRLDSLTELSAIVTQNETFYQGLSMRGLEGSVEGVRTLSGGDVPISREISSLSEHTAILRQQFWNFALKRIRIEVGEKAFTNFVRELDQTKLGVTF